MIREIKFKNVKGQTSVQELTGLDIFVGRNGAGKTTRLQSLGISMLGYVPGAGKTAADTFKLATGTCMTVGLKIQDGFAFSRTYTKKETTDRKTGLKKAGITETVAVSPGKGEKNDTEKRARIMAEVGHFPVMMDFGEFLSLSDAKRRDFIYSLRCDDSETWSREMVADTLFQKLLTAELQENNPEQYQVMEKLLNQVIGQFPAEYGVQDGLRSMIDWTTAQRSFWDSKKKDAMGAVRQISEMKNELAETDRNIVQHKHELEELQQQLITVEKRISADAEKKKNIDRRNIRIAELTPLVAELQKQSVDSDTSDIDLQIEELKKQLTEPPNIDEETAPLKKRLSEIQQNIKTLDNQERAINEKIITVRSTVTSLDQAMNKTKEINGRCIIHQLISCPRDFNGFDQFVAKRKEDADKTIAQLETEQSEINRQIAELRREQEKIDSEREAILQKYKMINSQNRLFQDRITALARERNERLLAGQRRENQINMYNQELSRLMNEPVDAIGPTDIQEKQATGIRNRIEELKQSIAGKEKARQTILLLQQSMVENRRAEYSSICLKTIAEALGPKGIQGELVKEMLNPILDDIRSNLKLMGFNEEPYFQANSDNGKEIFQFGWINDWGHAVNFDALSTGQQTIFLAAMMMTIIDWAKPKLKILAVDNLNHLDRLNFQMLIDGLSKLAHKLDNIILAGAIEFPFVASDWKVWDLSGEVRKSA